MSSYLTTATATAQAGYPSVQPAPAPQAQAAYPAQASADVPTAPRPCESLIMPLSPHIASQKRYVYTVRPPPSPCLILGGSATARVAALPIVREGECPARVGRESATLTCRTTHDALDVD